MTKNEAFAQMAHNKYEEEQRQMCKNALIQENRIGQFLITRRTLMDTHHSALTQLFGTMIVVRAESDFQLDSITYTSFSSLFPPAPLNTKPPEYYILAYQDTDNEWSFTIEDRTGSWNGMNTSISYNSHNKEDLPFVSNA